MGKCVPGYFVRRAKVPIILISGSLISFIFAHNKASQSICHGPISGICRGYLSQFTRFYSIFYLLLISCVQPGSLCPPTSSNRPFHLLFLSTFSSADRHIGARRPLGAPGGVAPTVGSDVGHQQQPQQHGVSSVGGPKSRERRDTARSASWAADYSHGE